MNLKTFLKIQNNFVEKQQFFKTDFVVSEFKLPVKKHY